jgi:hypothetical protein
MQTTGIYNIQKPDESDGVVVHERERREKTMKEQTEK